MRLGVYFTWLNKIAIVYKVTIKLFLRSHYRDKNECSHVLFGHYFMIIVRTFLKAHPDKQSL